MHFSTLKRVVKGRCSCRPQRESIHVKPIFGQVQMLYGLLGLAGFSLFLASLAGLLGLLLFVYRRANRPNQPYAYAWQKVRGYL